MNEALIALIAELDAMEPPRADSAAAERYKEWHHFNIQADEAGCHLIINLGLAGGSAASGERLATLVALAHLPGGGWRGAADVYDRADIAVAPGAVDLAIGGSAVRFDRGQYAVHVALRDGSVRATVALAPRAVPLPIRNRVPFGGGANDWIIVPRLVATGEVRLADERFTFTSALAYHDHNRGYWRWQDDLGWDWGYALEPGNEDDRYSIVFERVTDRRHHPVGEAALVVWRGERIVKAFFRDALAIGYGPFREDLVAARVPAILNLLLGAPGGSVPGQIEVTARDGDDWLSMQFRVGSGLELLLPHEGEGGFAAIHELWGRYEVSGLIGGRQVEFANYGFAEWAAS